MPPILTSAATLQCPHGGVFPLVPRSPTPLVGGAPALTAADFPGLIAAGCTFNVAGAPVPCVIASVVSGMSTKLMYRGVPAVHGGLQCMTASGFPTMPPVPGQMTAQTV